MTRADKYADYEWHSQVTMPRAYMAMPMVGDTFIVPGDDFPMRIEEVFFALGETRFHARGVRGFKTFARIGTNKWRAFGDRHAPVFSL